MNNNLLSLTRALSATSTKREKAELLISSLLGAFYVFLTFYTIAKTADLLPRHALDLSSKDLMYLIAVLSAATIMQLTTAIGFLYSKPWIKYIVSLHAGATLLIALVLLPFFNLSNLSLNIFLNGIPYYLMGISVWFFTTLKDTSRPKLLLLSVYIFALVVAATIQLFLNK